MHIRPLHDRILVKRPRDDAAMKSQPDSPLVEARVIAVGEQASAAHADKKQQAFKPEQRVLYLGPKGLEFTLEGEDFVLVRERAIVATLED